MTRYHWAAAPGCPIPGREKVSTEATTYPCFLSDAAIRLDLRREPLLGLQADPQAERREQRSQQEVGPDEKAVAAVGANDSTRLLHRSTPANVT